MGHFALVALISVLGSLRLPALGSALWLITHSCQQALCCLQQNASPECTQQLLSSGCARHQYCTSTVQASVSALIVGVEHWNVKYRRLLRITEDGRDC